MKYTVFQAIKQSQSYTFQPGTYLVNLFGAQGGTGRKDGELYIEGGRGAKVSIVMKIERQIKIFIYVGSRGEDGKAEKKTTAVGGWNGGGAGGTDSSDDDGTGAGGGSTDLRLIDSTENDGVMSRIAVAAGGSGSAFTSSGSPGGDLYFYKMSNSKDVNSFLRVTPKPTLSKNKLFKGEDGRTHISVPSSGAGGGYFGGTTVNGEENTVKPLTGTGGTSFVAGCEADETDEVYERALELRFLIGLSFLGFLILEMKAMAL